MITLRITSQEETREASFNQNEIFIGPKGSSLCEIGIESSNLEEPHCKILFQNDRYTIINCSDDPEVTVNGLAFGKRSLVKGSQISIRGTTIEVLSTEEVKSELDQLLKQVDTLTTTEEKPQPVEPPKPTEKLQPTQNFKKRWMAVPSLIFLVIIGFFSLQSYMHSQKEKLEMEAALKLSDQAMNQLSLKLTGEPLHIRKFNSNVYTLKSENGTLTAWPTSKIHKWFGNLEPISIDLNTFTLTKGESEEPITLEELSTFFPEKNFQVAANARSLSPKSSIPVYNAPRYSALISNFEDFSDPDFSTYATLPNLIIYTALERDEAKEYGKKITDITKKPLMVGYKSGNEYLVSRVKVEPVKVSPPKPKIQEELTGIQRGRQESLKEITTEIQNLISENLNAPQSNNKKKLLEYLKKYEELDLESQEKMKEQILALYQSHVIENKDLNEDQFEKVLISEGFADFLDNRQ